MNKKKGVYSKLIVMLVIILNVWFADRVLKAFETVGAEPITLIGAWFAFTVGELFLLSSIKKTKEKKGKGEKNED